MASTNQSPSSGYRGRLAPSPTGYLHVGHARTFFTAYQRARDAGGVLVLRMEDLDSDRSRAVYANAAIEDLRWLGIRWHEGPDNGGPFAPYAQSRRHEVYLNAFRKLLRHGYLYPCRCSRRDLQTAPVAPHESGPAATAHSPHIPLDDEPIYPGTCRPPLTAPLITSEADMKEGVNWRFRVPDGEKIWFKDQNLGIQQFIAGSDFGDFVVWRRDGVPSYQVACVADDAAMRITEVVRGADLLKSTARQILLNRALDLDNPAWFHCRLILDQNGKRLAKRHDALSLRALRQQGLTPMNILSADLPIEV
jgi:glutamyl-tRNA synthetase